MARARNIKPGFFESEQVGCVTPPARLLFIALWQLADREGRLEDRPKRIHAYAFRYDTPGSIDTDSLLNELVEQQLIERYESKDLRVIYIPAFKVHQNPHHREPASELPEKASELPGKVRASLGQASELPGKPQTGLGITGQAQGQPQPSPNLAVLNPESLLLNPDGAVVLNRAAPPSPRPPRQQQPEFEPFDNQPDLTTVVSEAVEAVAQHWPYLGNVPNAKRAWEREAARAVEGGLVWCDKIQRTALVHSLAHAACKRSTPNHYVPSLERWVQDGDYARKPPTPRESKNMSLADLLYPEDTSHAS